MPTNTTLAGTTPAASTTKPVSKSTAVIKLLTRARGATVAEMQVATSWQPHSVRAYLSGLRKAGRALDKEERKSGETSYRLGAVPLPATPAATIDTIFAAAPAVDTAAVAAAGAGSNVEAYV